MRGPRRRSRRRRRKLRSWTAHIACSTTQTRPTTVKSSPVCRRSMPTSASNTSKWRTTWTRQWTKTRWIQTHLRYVDGRKRLTKPDYFSFNFLIRTVLYFTHREPIWNWERETVNDCSTASTTYKRQMGRLTELRAWRLRPMGLWWTPIENSRTRAIW